MDHHEHSDHNDDNVVLATTWSTSCKLVDHHNHNDNKDNNDRDNNKIVLAGAWGYERVDHHDEDNVVLARTNIQWTTRMMARMTTTPWYWLPLTKDGVQAGRLAKGGLEVLTTISLT